jgi:inhibitor of nuclear factor kappa-B kinase subunit alpha
MSNQRTQILALHELKKRNCEIARSLRIDPAIVCRTIKRYKELGHDGRRPGSGRKRTVNTTANRKIIKKRVQRNPRVSMRKISRDTGISRESVRQMAKKELHLKPFKIQKVQLLTDENKRVRLQRCHQLKRRAAAQRWERILFTDEKLFSVEQAHNHQNDRIWSPEAPGTSAIVQHRQNPQSVMVWGGICANGKTPLVFVAQGVKINQEVYRRDILQAVVLPWAQQHFGNVDWVFQQDSAPAHRAKATQDWCKTHFPDFIASAEWPPYSPDLNPMDYSVWSILEARACAKPHKSLESLKQSLRREWDRLSPEDLRPIANNFKSRLDLCIAAKGGHFETG